MDPRAGTTPEDGLRLAWVDVAKGLCILLVVTMHATLGTGAAMGGEGFLHPLVAFAQPFRIPAFFLLSGLFLGRVIGRGWRTFADKRVVHFAYFYGLWLLIQSAAKYGEIAGAGGPAAFLRHLALALVEPYASLWFIYLLAVFSVVTKLLRRLPGPVLLGGAALLQVFPPHTPSYLVEEFCARYVFFVAGYLFAGRVFALAEAVRARPGPALGALALWALAEGWIALTPAAGPGSPPLASLPGLGLAAGALGAVALVAAAVLLAEGGGPVARALRSCGHRSIAIYLAFFLPMAVARTLVVETGLITDVGLACLIVAASAALVPLVLERLVRGTRLDVLFRRPRAFHLAGTGTPDRADAPLAPRPAPVGGP